MTVQDLSIQDFLYNLPDERIAKYPLPNRDRSRLLLYRSGEIGDAHFQDLPLYIPTGAVLVRNNSRVIHARLLFRKPSGAQIEVFCLTPLEPASYDTALDSKLGCSWQCMLGNARRWRIGDKLEYKLELEGSIVCLYAERIGQSEISFSWSNEGYTFGELLEQIGILPIPPYLNRSTEEQDTNTYQTIYAQTAGSVAAPTAGLHFTPNVFADLNKRGIQILDVTLHVGAGTFRPVKAQSIGEHDMHEEFVQIDKQTIEQLQKTSGPIIAIGTTSVRSLESLYHLGAALRSNQELDKLHVTQWQPYHEANNSCTPLEALDAILNYMSTHSLDIIAFSTSILIAPGYKFRLVRGLITNFHQPHSTLLLLIAAFVGQDWRNIYDHALENDYRFLSYGDSSLLLP